LLANGFTTEYRVFLEYLFDFFELFFFVIDFVFESQVLQELLSLMVNNLFFIPLILLNSFSMLFIDVLCPHVFDLVVVRFHFVILKVIEKSENHNENRASENTNPPPHFGFMLMEYRCCQTNPRGHEVGAHIYDIPAVDFARLGKFYVNCQEQKNEGL